MKTAIEQLGLAISNHVSKTGKPWSDEMRDAWYTAMDEANGMEVRLTSLRTRYADLQDIIERLLTDRDGHYSTEQQFEALRQVIDRLNPPTNDNAILEINRLNDESITLRKLLKKCEGFIAERADEGRRSAIALLDEIVKEKL